ncbi:type II secretion system F family protein [Haloarchaeobius amylolyticus]|uniref:type II secretion system F family protein n=1 Tax=Haloarchaeobius amylolyticus TaxID=1198296 RepID=UPI002270DD7B|nr:type II secretion system F family protein [Haloarchaeobius amylolyticus]
MSWANYVPLVLAICIALPVVLSPVSVYADRIVTRFSLIIFGKYISQRGRKRNRRKQLLRAAHIPTTYRTYASKTALYTAAAALVGSILGMYFIWLGLIILAIDAETIRAVFPPELHFLANFVGLPTISVFELFALMAVTSLTLGASFAGMTYWYRWWYPDYRGDERERRIEASLPRTIAFIYALSRSGMEFPKVMRILAENQHIYGESAEEVHVAVRNMDMFGQDMITAIHTMARRSPSSQFKEFAENLASVLQSGRSLSEFLHQQYRDFQEEAESQQEKLLDLLATLAEAYVTVLVAGPLFLITILVVLGIAVGDTLDPLRVFVYVILPCANLIFILYLLSATDTIATSRGYENVEAPVDGLSGVRRANAPQTDGGYDGYDDAGNVARLKAYRQFRSLRSILGNPFRTVVEKPLALLWVTVPLALLIVLLRLPGVVDAGGLNIREFDDLLIQAALFVIGTFAIAYEVHRRRAEAIEAAVPDLLDRLASVNEAGMTVVESIERVRRSELGALDTELDRVWADIRWGADIETALRRFEARMRTQIISRVVTITTKAMNASGDLATVLRIAANQAKADRRLKRARRQEMVTYMVVVYLAFFVFLFIVVVLSIVLIPSLPEGGTTAAMNATGGGTASAQNVPAVGGVGQTGSIDKDEYILVFFHTTIIQGLLSGLVAGQLSSGDIRTGAKHAAILIAMAYATFIVLIPGP